MDPITKWHKKENWIRQQNGAKKKTGANNEVDPQKIGAKINKNKVNQIYKKYETETSVVKKHKEEYQVPCKWKVVCRR